MNKKGMSILSLVLLFTALTIGLVVTSNVGFDVDKFKGKLNITEVDITIEDYPELEHALEYYINGMIKAYVELVKWVAEFSSQHPELPYKLLIYLLVISLLAPIFIVAFKFLIIIFILIKEYIQNRREKKLLYSKPIEEVKGGSRT